MSLRVLKQDCRSIKIYMQMSLHFLKMLPKGNNFRGGTGLTQPTDDILFDGRFIKPDGK
jgi:hypothetical protein